MLLPLFGASVVEFGGVPTQFDRTPACLVAQEGATQEGWFVVVSRRGEAHVQRFVKTMTGAQHITDAESCKSAEVDVDGLEFDADG